MIETRFILFHAGRLFALLLSIFPLLLPFAASHAQGESVRLPVKAWQKTLDEAEKEISQPDIKDSRLLVLRDQLAELKTQVRAAAETASQQGQVLRSDLEALGPPPAEGQPPEAPTLVERRKSLNEALALAEGAVKEAELIITRADRLTGDVKNLRRTRFTERVLSRGQSPLAGAVWQKALSELVSAWNVLYVDILARLSGQNLAGEAAIGKYLAAGVGLALLLAFPLRSWLIRRFGYQVVEGSPTYLQRLWAAAFTGVVRALLPSMAAAAVYLSLWYGDFLSESPMEIAWTFLLALVSVFFVAGFCRSALAPYEPDWRLVPIHDYGARAASRAVTSLALLFGLDRVLSEAGSQYGASVELIAVQKFVFGLLISAGLLALLRHRIWFAEGQAELGHGWQRLRYFLGVLVGAIPLTAVSGYVVLSRLLATQWVLTAALYALVTLLRRIAAQSIAQLLSGDSALGRRLGRAWALSTDGAEMLRFWLAGSVDLLILLLGLAALLMLWGVSGKDLAAWLESGFLEFRIGDLKISLAEILLGLMLFVVFLALTKTLQKFLEQRIFPRTRLDLGLRHSIRSAVGYVGFTLATILAVSAMGVDLSNLAIIAGALSVGIGFGLQNIVNNFVSGLILLVERPIKVGDWVVVGEHQGYVKKISVRATEITTFDRASVFIPNSSLISGSVMNRTRADKVGRVMLPIGIAYDGNPKKAREVLLNIALAQPEIRRNPAPNVFFRGFGDHALNLELVAFLHDVDKVGTVTSELCFAIHEAFEKEGIRIPLPQREVSIGLDEAQWGRILGFSGADRRSEAPTPPGAPGLRQ